MASARTALVSAVSAGCGAGIGYLLDPDRGRARRAQLRDGAAAVLRRRRRWAGQRVRYGKGALLGRVREASGAGRAHPEDDVDVVQGIRQRLARLHVPMADVKIDVWAGAATLRGQLSDDEQIRRVQKETQKAPGVREVKSYLHLPGEPAPNKAAALHAAR